MHNLALRGRARHTVLTAIAVLILCVMLFPVYWMVNVALQRSGNVLNLSFFPLHPSFSSFSKAIDQQGRHLGISLVVALCSVAVSLAVATPAAHALALMGGRAKALRIALFAILLVQMVPSIAVANALYGAYNRVGLLNTLPGLILADATAGIPFGILLMRAFMVNIPPSILAAARVDGASSARVFFRIVVPVSINAIVTAGVFAFLFAWGDFLYALTLTTSDAVRPITLGIYQYVGAYGIDWGLVMATAVLACAPAIVLLVFAQRYISAGVTSGAVK